MWEKTGTTLALAKPSLCSGRTRPQYNCEYLDPGSAGLKLSLRAAAAFHRFFEYPECFTWSIGVHLFQTASSAINRFRLTKFFSQVFLRF
jgi:hypothetical protein